MIKRKQTPTEYIIRKFGGLRATARAVGRAPSGVHRWRVNGEIPIGAIKRILMAAEKQGLNISEKILITRR